MSDQNTTPPNVDDEIPDNDSWQEVGHQFQILGESSGCHASCCFRERRKSAADEGCPARAGGND